MKTPFWFLKKSLIGYLLLPFALVYFIISKLVYYFRKIEQKTSKRPVICIGNIFAGGVGKTPIVREIAKYFNAPIVMRGYKSNGESIGDEAIMLQNAGMKVFTGNRTENIESLNKIDKKTPIIMDDGFQNPTIKKDISILVFDEKLGFGNGFVLPAGPLREPVSAIARADAIIIIRNKELGTGNERFKKIIKRYKKPVFYAKSETINPVSGRVIAFAGIGYPQKFFRSISGSIKNISFPDHHNYSNSDLDKLFKLAVAKKATLITTEKDWVRLPTSAQKKIKFAKLNTIIHPEFFNWIKERLNENI